MSCGCPVGAEALCEERLPHTALPREFTSRRNIRKRVCVCSQRPSEGFGDELKGCSVLSRSEELNHRRSHLG